MKQITIKTSEGDRTVEATIRGQLAYHLMLGRTDYFAIVHVKSGLALFSYLNRYETYKIIKRLSVIDFDGYFDAGCPKGYMPKEHVAIWADLRDEY